MKDPLPGELADAWSQLVDGEPLSAEEEARLRARAESDPAWLAAVAEDAALHGWLSGFGEAQRDAHFVASVGRRLRAEAAAEAPGHGRVADAAAPKPAPAVVKPHSARARTRRAAYGFAALASAAGITLLVAALRREHAAEPVPPAAPALTQTLGTGTQLGDAGVAPPPVRPLVLHDVDAPAGLVAKETLMSFGFDRAIPGGGVWRYGEVGRCPPGGTGRCLRAVRYAPPHAERVGAQLQAADGALFTYDDDLYLRFDYWLGSTTGQPYRVQVEASDQHAAGATDIIFELGPPVTWNRVLVPLASLSWNRDRRVSLPRGLGIKSIQLVLWFSTNDLFLIDNVEVVRFGRQHDR